MILNWRNRSAAEEFDLEAFQMIADKARKYVTGDYTHKQDVEPDGSWSELSEEVWNLMVDLAECGVSMGTKNVEFVKYDAPRHSWCGGILTVKIGDEEVRFGHTHGTDGPSFWVSSGSCNWHTGEVVTGPWEFNTNVIPPKYQRYAAELCRVFEENVEPGCCGGCI